MNKKILIGSIIAVVILILVSFTGVVGYHTTSTTIAKASPLFKVRTSRALGEESKVLTCNYIGKGTTLPFPKRDDKSVLTQKVIDRIKKMDDETFEKFIANIIYHAQKDNRLNGVNPDIIREALNLIRDNDKSITIFNTTTNNAPLTLIGCPSFQCQWTIGYGLKGFLACILLLSFYLIVRIIEFIIEFFNPIDTITCIACQS